MRGRIRVSEAVTASIQDRVLKVFREVFQAPDLAIHERTKAADVAGWDSLNHINLVLALEEEFAVSFTAHEIGSMADVGDLYAALERKCGPTPSTS